MPKKDEDSITSEPWNIAKGYVTLKILTILVENDKLVKIALYGCEDINLSFAVEPQIKVLSRIEALKRVHTNLSLIFGNSQFAIMKKDLTKYEEYKTRINKIVNFKDPKTNEFINFLDNVSSEKVDERTHEKAIIINENLFNQCLTKLRDVMNEMNVELNNAQLIFPNSEEFNMEDIKEQLIHGG